MRAWLAIAGALAGCSVDAKRAVDPDATTDATPSGAPDTTPPDTTIVDAPARFSPSARAEFTFTSDDPTATFTCSIDGDTPIACASPYSRTLADGDHAFAVRAIDPAGNADPTPAEHLWAIDTVAPDTTIIDGPPEADNSTKVVFEFKSNELSVTFDCALDGGDYATCTSGQTFGPFGDGPHAFAVRAHDRAGNVDASPAIRSWVIDTSTPDTELLSGPTGSSGSTSASFTFLSPDAGPGATFSCRLDAEATFTGCTSPDTVANLAEGSHTFRVRVTDAVGNVDPTPATRTWLVDLTPPETTITAGPSGTVATASATIAFIANETSTFACHLDGAAFAACASPVALTGLAQGPHTFAVRATDGAGHVDPTPATIGWTVDTVPPDVAFTAGPANGATVGPRIDFQFTTSEGTPSCSLDGAAFAPCTSPRAFNVPAGSHAFAVAASDAAGNTTTATRTWTTACTAPTETGAFGLLHLDDGAQAQPNAVAGGAAATLGDTTAVEASDPTPIATAVFGGGLGFADNTHVAWPLAAAATATPTIAVWVQPTATKGATLVATGDNRFVLATAPAGPGVKLSIAITGMGAGSKSAAVVTSSAVALSAWHHVVASLDGSTLRLWVDGIEQEAPANAGAALAFDRVTIGGHYIGGVDEVWLGAAAVTTDDAALAGYCPQ